MKVLLVGDIGTNPKSGFYHVGDEAMFYQTYLAYTKLYPQVELTIFSKERSHTHLRATEQLLLPWPHQQWPARKRFFKLLLKTLAWKLFGSKFISGEELEFLKTVVSQDRVHFTGGGNITSLFPSWLYSTFFVLFVAGLHRTEVVLTSQTVGPLRGLDRVLAFFFLNSAKLIGLRERAVTQLALLQYGVFLPRIRSMIDAAYLLPDTTSFKLPTQKARYRIGLSIHEWKSYGNAVLEATSTILNSLSEQFSLEVVLIPHTITKDEQMWDRGYMTKLSSQLSKHITVINPSYSELMGNSEEPATTSKYLTSSVDLLLTTRYHGLVFALSSNVPCLTFVLEEYYRRKNGKVFEFVYDQDTAQKYLLDISSPANFPKHTATITEILTNLTEEKAQLANSNAQLKRSGELELSRLVPAFGTLTV